MRPQKLFSGDIVGPTSQSTMAAASWMGFLPSSRNLLEVSLKPRAWARCLTGERGLGALSGKLGCTGGPLVCDVWATGDQGLGLPTHQYNVFPASGLQDTKPHRVSALV